MKVLVVSSKFPPEYAGSGFRAHRTYLRLSRKYGVKYRVICNSIEFKGNKNYEYEGAQVTRISSERPVAGNLDHKRFRLRLRKALKYYVEMLSTMKYLSNCDFDLIHAFGNSASVAAAIYFATKTKKPAMLEICNYNRDRVFSPYPDLPLLVRLCPPDLSKNTVIVAISDEIRRKCAEFGYVDNVWCRPNPVDETRFHYRTNSEKIEYREKYYSFSSRDKVLLCVAKFILQKNHIFLLDVLSRLPDEYKLVLAGPMVTDGYLLNRDKRVVSDITKRIDSLGLSSRVYMNVQMVRIENYLSMADVFLFPAQNEALGTPLLESIGCGVPVIANYGEPAFRQHIADGENGYLCTLDADEWTAAIKKAVVFDDKRRKAMSDRILGIASTEIIDLQYMKILEYLAKNRYKKAQINVNDILRAVKPESPK